MTDLNLTKVNVTDLDYVYTMYSILDFLAQKHYINYLALKSLTYRVDIYYLLPSLHWIPELHKCL